MTAQEFDEFLAGRKVSLPTFGTGDQVRVWTRIVERDRTRLAQFEGIVIRRRGAGANETFIVRRVTHGEGVERVFPINGPMIDKIEVLQQARPPRSRLYFLRTKIGKTRIASAQPGGPSKAKEERPAAAAKADSAGADVQPTTPASEPAA